MTDWYPLATVHAGPAWKQYSGRNPNKGIVGHSAEGYRAGLLAEIGNPNRRAAWHFSVMKDGDVFQHYPISAILAHGADWGGDNDGANANGELIAIEHEGVAGEALTPAQRDASVALVRWIAQQGRWEPSRTTNKTLWEHRELSDEGTACPSNRIPWAYYTVAEVPKEPPKEKPVALTADQQYVVDQIRKNPGLTEAQKKAALAEVGLTAMPGEEAPSTPPPSSTGLTPQEQAQALRLAKEIKGRAEALEKLLGA